MLDGGREDAEARLAPLAKALGAGERAGAPLPCGEALELLRRWEPPESALQAMLRAAFERRPSPPLLPELAAQVEELTPPSPEEAARARIVQASVLGGGAKLHRASMRGVAGKTDWDGRPILFWPESDSQGSNLVEH